MAVLDDAADVIRQPAVGVRDVLAAFEDDDPIRERDDTVKRSRLPLNRAKRSRDETAQVDRDTGEAVIVGVDQTGIVGIRGKAFADRVSKSGAEDLDQGGQRERQLSSVVGRESPAAY